MRVLTTRNAVPRERLLPLPRRQRRWVADGVSPERGDRPVPCHAYARPYCTTRRCEHMAEDEVPRSQGSIARKPTFGWIPFPGLAIAPAACYPRVDKHFGKLLACSSGRSPLEYPSDEEHAFLTSTKWNHPACSLQLGDSTGVLSVRWPNASAAASTLGEVAALAQAGLVLYCCCTWPLERRR